jgi:hypothetical protein
MENLERIGHRLIHVLSEICLAVLRKTTKRGHMRSGPIENGTMHSTNMGLQFTATSSRLVYYRHYLVKMNADFSPKR